MAAKKAKPQNVQPFRPSGLDSRMNESGGIKPNAHPDPMKETWDEAVAGGMKVVNSIKSKLVKATTPRARRR